MNTKLPLMVWSQIRWFACLAVRNASIIMIHYSVLFQQPWENCIRLSRGSGHIEFVISDDERRGL